MLPPGYVSTPSLPTRPPMEYIGGISAGVGNTSEGKASSFSLVMTDA